MSERTFDLCVIGAGIGGFTAAALAAQLGARVALIEQGSFGGALLEGALALRALTASASAARRDGAPPSTSASRGGSTS